MKPVPSRHPLRRICLMLLAFSAGCVDPVAVQHTPVSAGDTTSRLPVIQSANQSGNQTTIVFSRDMDRDSVAAATLVYKLRDHAYDELNAAADRVASDLSWPDDRTLTVTWDGDPGTYVLQITSGAQSAGGAFLDGLAPGVVAGIHRPADDGLVAPRPWRSAPIHLGSGVPLFFSYPAGSQLAVTAASAWHDVSGTGPRDDGEEPLWAFGRPRVSIVPPYGAGASLRVSFFSNAGFPMNLVSVGAIGSNLRLYQENDARIGASVNLSHLPRDGWTNGQGVEIGGIVGRRVTTTTGPAVDLDTMRKAGETVWMVPEGDPWPRGLILEIEDYDGSDREYTFDRGDQPVAASIWGATATTERRFYDGELRGGYSLRDGTGFLARIRDATDTTIYLDRALPVASCDDCELTLDFPGERMSVGDVMFAASDHWYLHPDDDGATVVQFLSVNDTGSLRNVLGQPFRDLDRDGDESADPPVADDEFIIQLSFREKENRYPPATRLNNGIYYDTLFESLGLPCLGGTEQAICVELDKTPDCAGVRRPVDASFSLYTADGSDDQPYGSADLIEVAFLEPSEVALFDRSGNPLGASLSNRVVLNETDRGTFPTTLLTVTILADGGPCADGQVGRRGFRDGDRLVIDHNMRPLVPSNPKSIDGNGDGIAESRPRDDWIGIWEAAAGTFVPLDRRPGRD